MNSNSGRSNNSKSTNTFDFDLGLNSNNSKSSLNDQKNKAPSYSYSNTTPSWQPNKPSWTHQPAPIQSTRPGSLSGPSSMVGDISGKSWSSVPPSNAASGNIGIVNKNPNLFSDLVGLGKNKGSTNVPLKNSAPASNNSAYSMGSMSNSLPKMSNSANSYGGYGSGYNNGSNANVGVNKGANLGGPSLKSAGGSGMGGGMNSKKDPFGSLVDFGTKPAGDMNTGTKSDNKAGVGNDPFGDFQNASKSSTPPFSSGVFGGGSSNTMGSSTGSYSKMDDFGIPSAQKQPSVQSTGDDAYDVLFSTSSAPTGGAAMGSDDLGSQQFSGGADDWGVGSEFGGADDTAGTTELEGLPPPPSGVTPMSAKNKGMDNYKQGQYPDAIKWLSWAVILLQKGGDNVGTMEVLSSRASCYKEVGEYKKAVADCTKVLEHDSKNVAVLVQRALLYESMEKYKLGAEDLRTVMKLDPGNRVARSTIHRLLKMAD
ncbi:hypothetical protein RJ640_014771 [Escallonia rubra]|uniref:Sperm-associated antigen 1A n=1 Tax=Escallonia rubra TaxID=112253 RepID=A0AA88UUQ6_9ASTE|nr:hypothetical protein RJ640_014771 [Escallonia rubra]